MRPPLIGSEHPPAVIVGFALNGLGVARALAAHGIRCIGVTGPAREPATRTRTCEVIACPEWSGEALLQRLVQVGQQHRRKLPLLITMEAAVRWISQGREQLAELYEISLPPKPVVEALLDKALFERQCARERWPTPRTWHIRSREQLLEILRELPFPCILKPETHTIAFGERSPSKAFKLGEAGALVRTYDMASRWASGFVVQEWIEGGDERIAFCLTYVARDGRARTLFPGRKLRQFPPECGNTALCEPAPAPWREPVVRLTEMIWDRVGFRGLGSVEYKMRIGSDEPVIMEPTVGRTNYQNELAVLNGVNLPLIAYCDLAGLPPPELSAPAKTCKLVDGMRELRSARHYMRNRTLTWRQWRRDRSGRCRYMTFRATDPWPFLATLVSGVGPLVGRVVEQLFGRSAKLRLKHALQDVRSAPRSGAGH